MEEQVEEDIINLSIMNPFNLGYTEGLTTLPPLAG
jgi:hypothetical protein